MIKFVNEIVEAIATTVAQIEEVRSKDVQSSFSIGNLQLDLLRKNTPSVILYAMSILNGRLLGAKALGDKELVALAKEEMDDVIASIKHHDELRSLQDKEYEYRVLLHEAKDLLTKDERRTMFMDENKDW